MGLVKCVAIFFGVCVAIFIVCKWLNFSIIPEGMVIPKPKKFSFPKMRRDEKGEWVIEEEEESSDEDSSDEDTEDESSDEDSEDSEDFY